MLIKDNGINYFAMTVEDKNDKSKQNTTTIKKSSPKATDKEFVEQVKAHLSENGTTRISTVQRIFEVGYPTALKVLTTMVDEGFAELNKDGSYKLAK